MTLTNEDKQRIDGIRAAAGERLVSLGNKQAKWDADPRPIVHPEAHRAKGKRLTDQHCLVSIAPEDVVWLCDLAAPNAGAKADLVTGLLQASSGVLASPNHPEYVHLQANHVALLCDLACPLVGAGV